MRSEVFRPLDIGALTIPNRIVRTAHGVRLPWIDEADDLIAYHEARARGGVGLSMLGNAGVHRTSMNSIPVYDDRVISGYQRMMKRIAPTGMKLFQQIWHGGAAARPGSQGLWSASEVVNPRVGRRPTPLTPSMIDELVESFALAASRVQEGHLDGVEIHAAHGYLIAQFLSPATNHRTDEYGGSLTNRTRFLRRIISAVRAQVGPGFPVGVRLSANEHVTGGIGPTDALEIARTIEPTVDFINVSVGSYYRMDLFSGTLDVPLEYEIPDARVVTENIAVPSIVTGRIMTLDDANRLIGEGVADMVSMVRATIADPTLVEKSRVNRPDAVRPCIGTNQGCIGAALAGQPFGCIVNPAAGNELTTPFETPQTAQVSKSVVVIGGGPAGLEAARAAAERGHEVELYERARKLGGQLALAANDPHRSDLGVFTAWLEAEVRRLDVVVRLGAAPDPDALIEADPDVVIVATGSESVLDGSQVSEPSELFEGIDLQHVFSASQVLDGSVRHGKTAFVFDDSGDYDAVSVVEKLVAEKYSVVVATRAPTIAATIPAHEVTMAGAHRRMAQAHVEHIPCARVVAIDEEHVDVMVTGGVERRIPADTVVIVGVKVPQRDYADYFADYPFDVHVIGDATGTTSLSDAVAHGWAAGRQI